MTYPDPAGALLLAAALGLFIQGLRLARRWRIGRPAQVDWVGGLRRLSHAYFHTVHDVVARDPYAARMHVMAAGGLVAALLFSIVLHVGGIGGRTVAAATMAAAIVAFVGTWLAAWRRRPPRPRRLTGGVFTLLPLAIAGALVFLLLAALRICWPAAPNAVWLDGGWIALDILGAVSLGTLLVWVVEGPMRHAVAGTIHLITHSRPLRLVGAIDAALQPLDLSELCSGSPNVPKLGAEVPADFAWTRLAAFDACVQCGRCQEACPAFAAGQPLNPKQMIQSLVRATEISNAGGETSLISLVAAEHGAGVIRPETLWACTTCRACVHECPMLIEHVDAIIDMRRYETLERGAVPAKVSLALSEIRATDTVSGRALDARLDWAADLALPLLSDRRRADVLLWLGEGAFDRRNQHTLRALVRILRVAGVDFAVLGNEELDCGDLARRLGDEVTFQTLAARNIETLSRYTFGLILTVDPHALHTLRNEYPDLGGRYVVTHHAAYLDRLFVEGRLAIAEPVEVKTITYHDPCYLGRYNGEIAAPRRLLDRLGIRLVEMERSGLRSHCCGGGGGAPLADIAGDRRIPDIRMDHARATNAGTVAVACPNCAQMLEGVVGPRPTVADIAELVLDALGERAPPRRVTAAVR